jgi:hypothetical protein
MHMITSTLTMFFKSILSFFWTLQKAFSGLEPDFYESLKFSQWNSDVQLGFERERERERVRNNCFPRNQLRKKNSFHNDLD